MRMVRNSLLLCLCAKEAAARTWYVSAAAKDAGDGSQGKPFKRVNSAAAVAQPGDVVQVGTGVYRERVAPVNSGTEDKPITYKAADGEHVVLTASEVLEWKKSDEFDGSWTVALPDSLFDTLDGTPQTRLYNPFEDWMQGVGGKGASCNEMLTGQVYYDGEHLPSILSSDLHKCGANPYKPEACFAYKADGKSLYARWPKKYNNTMPESVEVTVRSRVFAPHKRGLQYIVVEGFVIEHAANQWIANFWVPENYHYAQSGAIGTRTGYRWTIRNNTIRHAGTIGLDIGSEGGYEGHPVDNEETNQTTPELYGEHTVVYNTFEKNRCSAVQGYGGSGTFSYNIIQDNGGCGCTGAENAAFKTHGFKGPYEGNVFRRNTGGAPIWFDGNGGPTHFTRNVILVADQNAAVVFELGDGPVNTTGFTHTLADNNIIVGNGGGGIGAQDACGIVLGHNLIVDGGTSVTLGGLTGRNSGMYDWWVEGNMLLTATGQPWLHMHKRKIFGGKDAIRNETVQHNLVNGDTPVFPSDAPDVHVDSNEHSDVAVSVDRERMVLTVTGPADLDKTGCQVGGPGGDIDFTGAKRSSSKCVPGPFASLSAGQTVNISLWPTGTVPPPSPTPPLSPAMVI